MLREAHYEFFDFGDGQPKPDDDYQDSVVPLAHAVAFGKVHIGMTICGSGVGACIAPNKVPGVRACLIHECFSARQVVEDDDHERDLPGRPVQLGKRSLGDLVQVSPAGKFSGAERHRRRLAKVASLESESADSEQQPIRATKREKTHACEPPGGHLTAWGFEASFVRITSPPARN